MHKVSSLYVHFPFCRHLCNYCDFYKVLTADRVDIGPFHSYLIRALAEHQRLMQKNDFSWAPLETLYFGGGTPSLWDQDGAKFFQGLLNAAGIHLDNNCEFTMEINPGTLKSEVLEAWQAIGLNRYSVGLQSLDARFLALLDRAHTMDESLATIESLRGLNFSVDFMLGLPQSDRLKRNIRDELLRALEFGPSHFSVYILTVKDNYKHFADLPDESYVADEYLEVCELLAQHGYPQYEVSNFARPGYESRHNMKYWMGQSVAAIGPSATGLLRRDADHAIRYKWKPQSPEFQPEELQRNELMLEDLYLRMRLAHPMDYREYLRETDWPAMGQLLDQWLAHSLATIDAEGRFWLTPEGMLKQDGLMNDIFIRAKGL